MYQIAVFVSGKGTNLKAILEVTHGKGIEIIAVISDKLYCPAFEIAEEFGIKRYSVSDKIVENFISYENLAEELTVIGVDLIVLAGFLKKIPGDFIDIFDNKIINIHPALLPLFGGKGMYGMNVHKAVFNSHMKVSGATVHFVDKIYDNGKIIAQQCTDISDCVTPEEIAERVLKIEHKLLPAVIEKFAEKTK